jgi:hypothetical protein
MYNETEQERNGLISYSKNINSQYGEDGIIEEVLRRISSAIETNGWCVEFGAWDGRHLSNTYNLIYEKGFKAVLIEGDVIKYNALCENIPREDVFKVCDFVTFEGKSTLDNILKATPIPSDFDFLSIDIDGCDYYIFDSLKQYQPKIVCVEYNPSIPNEVEFIQPKNFEIKQGASAKSITTLANKKGYSLVAVTECNLILVRNDLTEYVIGTQNYSVDNLRDDAQSKTFLFVGYDGTILSNKKELYIRWHGVSQNLREIQFIPKVLRTFPSDYGLIQKILFGIWLTIKKPTIFMKKLNGNMRSLLDRHITWRFK